MNKVDKWALAIMEFEGWSKGSVSYRNNNPGNLKWPGGQHDMQGHSIFGNFQDGYDTLVHQLTIALNGTSRVYKPTDSISDFFHKYAEANSDSYAEFIANRFHCEVAATIEKIFGPR